jgi:perosamine synthetase
MATASEDRDASGLTWRGQPGPLADVGAFGFSGNKAITTGEGGMLATNDDELASGLRLLQLVSRREARLEESTTLEKLRKT